MTMKKETTTKRKRIVHPIKVVRVKITSTAFKLETTRELPENKINAFLNKMKAIKYNQVKHLKGKERRIQLSKIRFEYSINHNEKTK